MSFELAHICNGLGNRLFSSCLNDIFVDLSIRINKARKAVSLFILYLYRYEIVSTHFFFFLQKNDPIIVRFVINLSRGLTKWVPTK